MYSSLLPKLSSLSPGHLDGEPFITSHSLWPQHLSCMVQVRALIRSVLQPHALASGIDGSVWKGSPSLLSLWTVPLVQEQFACPLCSRSLCIFPVTLLLFQNLHSGCKRTHHLTLPWFQSTVMAQLTWVNFSYPVSFIVPGHLTSHLIEAAE